MNDLRIVCDFKRRCEVACNQLMLLSAEADTKLDQPQISYENNTILIENTLPSIEVVEICPIETYIEPVKFEVFCDNSSFNKICISTIFTQTIDLNGSINILQTEIEIKQEKLPVKTKDYSSSSKLKANQCPDCDKIFSRPTHLKRHMTIHTDERAYACDLCDKKFRRSDHLKTHQNFHTQNKPHTCQHCQTSFSRAEHLRRHILCRHRENPKTFSCKDCNFVAETLKLLNVHRKIHADVSSFECKICNESFDSKPELTDHLKTHNDERPYLCSECGMRFIRNDYLVIHMRRRHTGERPYKCKFFW